MSDLTTVPTIAHVPMAFSTQGSTLMTVTQRLAQAHTAIGGKSVAVLSDNRDLVAPGLETIYVDYTENCPREWFTKTELAVDVMVGAAGRLRPHHGKMYDPAIRALTEAPSDIVLLYEGHYASASLPRWAPVRKKSELCLYVHNPLSRTYGPFELRRLLEQSDRVVFCADHLRANVMARVGKIDREMEVVRNGVDEVFFSSAARSAPEDEFLVLFAGKVAPHKGVHLVIEAAGRAATRTSRKLRVRIIGSSDYSTSGVLSEYEEQLRQSALTTGVPVDFIPFLAPAELAAELGRAGVVCLPSTWAEGLPLIALESMAAGSPIVCSESAGMLEACGDVAITAPMGDSLLLADGIVLLAENPEEWVDRSSRARARAENARWEHTAREILDGSAG